MMDLTLRALIAIGALFTLLVASGLIQAPHL